MPVMTSVKRADAQTNEKAVDQINKSFRTVKKFTVGCAKPDLRGYDDSQTVQGVTAISVSEILPLQQAELLKLCIVLNEDEITTDCMKAANLNNGHMLHGVKQDDGSFRKAMYRCNQSSVLPSEIQEPMLGSKRSLE